MGRDERDGPREIMDNALAEMAEEAGGTLGPSRANLAAFRGKTGLTRSKARTLKKKGFKVTPHGRCGTRARVTVPAGFTDTTGELLRGGVTNSSVCLDRIRERGYEGGLTTVKDHVAGHRYLVPARRRSAAVPQGSRGRRSRTRPGEAYQVDWGFVNVEDWLGGACRIACLALVCHHCGTSYVGLFPNARRESPSVGMARAFMLMGVPEWVSADNMRSVVIRRDSDGRPVWQADYATFMACVGLETRLCRPRHPFTKGRAGRPVRLVRESLLAGRAYESATQPDASALEWRPARGSRYRKAPGRVPPGGRVGGCSARAALPEVTNELSTCLCPRRRTGFDGLAGHGGRRLGVPHWHPGRSCRVSREGRCPRTCSDGLPRELAVREAAWSRRGGLCEGQYADGRPEEVPSVPAAAGIAQTGPPARDDGLAKSGLGRGPRRATYTHRQARARGRSARPCRKTSSPPRRGDPTWASASSRRWPTCLPT